MSSHWSTTAQNGSVNGGSGGFGRQQVPVGRAVDSFDFENVTLDASIPSSAASQRITERHNNLAAIIAVQVTVVNTPDNTPQPQQQADDGASPAPGTGPLVFGTGTRFNNSPQ